MYNTAECCYQKLIQGDTEKWQNLKLWICIADVAADVDEKMLVVLPDKTTTSVSILRKIKNSLYN